MRLNPVALAAVFGLMKGVLSRPTAPAAPISLGEVLLGPLREEAMYRAGSHYAGLPNGFSAFAFAADHLVSEKHGSVSRFADVFVGGLLYEQAYRRYGFFGAFVAHALHNLGCHLGARAARKGAEP